MLGFLIGTVCLVGLIRMVRRGRRWGHGGPSFAGYGGCEAGHACDRHGDDRRGYGESGPDFFGGEGPGRRRWRRGFGRNAILRAVFERLDTSPGQEKAIRAALAELRVVAKSVKDDVKGTRADIARAMRGEHLGDEALADVSARLTVASEAMRRAAADALSKVHEALDEQQRASLADFIESGPGFRAARHFGGFGGGPYRAGAV